MQSRASSLIAAAFMAAFVFAAQTTSAAKAKGPPLAGIWNIAPSGRAASSGDLHFRITRNGGTPVDVKVSVNALTCDAEKEALLGTTSGSGGATWRAAQPATSAQAKKMRILGRFTPNRVRNTILMMED